ncbi:tetratricopeptide repeat-containing sensor histidine kinase [Pseudotenacibaculum haliotis]|uniref:histidine kinase n=1 Tax=Pseudotenacibaculum haliotis TaxID=1862138 RepID=A0ABW5LVB4_9FLAO
MKTKKLTFLLYCIVILCIQNLNAQINQDSLDYYIGKVSNGAGASILGKAYVFFDKYKASNLEQGHKIGAAYALDYMSEIEKELGLFYDSERTAVEGLKLLDSLPVDGYNIIIRNRLINRIGLVHWKYNKYEESLKYYFKLLKIVQSKSDSATVYNNIGISYKYLKEYDSAKDYLKKAYNLSKQIEEKHSIKEKSLDNLGFVQAMLNEKEGLSNMMKALDVRKTEKKDLYLSYRHLTEFYILKKDTRKALFYAKKAYDIAVEYEGGSDQLEALQNLLELGQYGYTTEFLRLNTEVKLDNQRNENKFSKAKYDLSKSEARAEKERANAERAKAKAATEKLEKTQLQVLGAFIVFMLIGTIFILRVRYRKKMLVKQFETEQRISEKLHDEVANDVFHTITKVRGEKTDQQELLNFLDDIYHKVRNISKANIDLDVNQDFGRLLNDLIISYKTKDVNIFTTNSSKIAWSEVSEIKRKVLYRVVQELMINMRKHSQASLVTLKFNKEKGKINIEYIDNGVGCELEKGSGLRNMESRMELVGGTITFESENQRGFRANLIL